MTVYLEFAKHTNKGYFDQYELDVAENFALGFQKMWDHLMKDDPWGDEMIPPQKRKWTLKVDIAYDEDNFMHKLVVLLTPQDSAIYMHEMNVLRNEFSSEFSSIMWNEDSKRPEIHLSYRLDHVEDFYAQVIYFIDTGEWITI